MARKPKAPKPPWKQVIPVLMYAIIRLLISLWAFSILINNYGWLYGFIGGIAFSIILNILLKPIQKKYLKNQMERIAKWKEKQKKYENYINGEHDKVLREMERRRIEGLK